MGLFGNSSDSPKQESTGFEDRKYTATDSGLYVPDVDYFDGEDSTDVTGGIFTKMRDGENYILMLPSNDRNRKTPWLEYGQHFLCSPFDKDKIVAWLNLEDWPETVERSYACTLNIGRCYLHELVKKLSDSKRSADKNLAKRWFGKTRYIANIVSIDGNGNKIVKPFPFGKGIKDDLVLAVKQDRLRFYDPAALLPIRITKTGTGLRTNYKVKVMENSKAISITKEWRDAMRDLNSLVPPTVDSVEEMNNIMEELNLMAQSSGSSADRGSGSDRFGFGGGSGSSGDSDDIPF